MLFGYGSQLPVTMRITGRLLWSGLTRTRSRLFIFVVWTGFLGHSQ